MAVLVKFLTATYQRGISLNSVNSAGRQIIDDLTKSIAASPARSAKLTCRDKIDSGSYEAMEKCTKDEAYHYTFYQKYGKVIDKKGGGEKEVPLYGAFCTGRYSYVWNSGYLFNKNYRVISGIKPVVLEGYNDKNIDPEGKKPIRLLRVQDPRRNVCAGHVSDGYDYKQPESATEPKYKLFAKSNIQIEMDKSAKDDEFRRAGATELIGDTEGGVAIYDLRLFAPAVHASTSQAIYSGTMILATTMGKVDITSFGEYCKEQSTNFTTEFSYCALNKFNFAARSLGKMRESEQLERNIYE